MTDIQFDTIEKLLQTKDHIELTHSEKEWVSKLVDEDEYTSMREFYVKVKDNRNIEVDPSPNIKKRLDKAFFVYRKPSGLFLHRTPLYQSVAAAMLFFFVGFGINYFRESPVQVTHNTTEVIKYIDRPVKQIEYIKVYEKQAPLVQEVKVKESETIYKSEETNPDFSTEISDYMSTSEIAMINFDQVLNETNGISIGSDTLIQKMLKDIQ